MLPSNSHLANNSVHKIMLNKAPQRRNMFNLQTNYYLDQRKEILQRAKNRQNIPFPKRIYVIRHLCHSQAKRIMCNLPIMQAFKCFTKAFTLERIKFKVIIVESIFPSQDPGISFTGLILMYKHPTIS